MSACFTELVIDCKDPKSLASFWMAVLGWHEVASGDGEVEIGDSAGVAPTMLFVPVLEAKTIKNRFHIDINPVGQDQSDELDRLIALGATHVDIGQGDQTWFVLADPEGNEFCLLRSRRD